MARKYRGRNEGSLSQRPNGSWRAQLSSNGRWISNGFKTKAEAQDWLRSTQIEVERGFDYHAGKISLAEYLPNWLEIHRVTLRPKTADQYRRVIEKHILPHLGDIQVKNLRISRVEHFYSELIQSGMGVRTVRIVHAILHKSLEKALRYGLVMSNPTQGAALPRYRQSEMQVLDENQVAVSLVAAQDSSYLALYHLALTTGMRQGELLGLKWIDLQWHSGALIVQRQLQDIRGQGTFFQEPKTRAGQRTIKLGEGTLQILRL